MAGGVAMEVEEPARGPEPFDLEAYIGNYTAHSKVDRLLFIADKSVGKPLELEALKIAADELKQSLRETFNTGRYREVLGRINGRLGSAYDIDKGLLDQVEKAADARQERIETDLHGSKTNLIKESIRMGHNDLGDFYYSRGDLQNAFKCYVRTRDYCTTPQHITSMCLNVVRSAIEMGNFMHVQNYVSKAEQTPEVQSDAVTNAKLKAATGLAFLDSRKYKLAARKFVEVSPELQSQYSDVIAPQDIALYGGLCALASFDRAELRSRVISNITFREFLELYPEIRELIQDFYNSRYASCLSLLDRLKPTLLLDIHLHDHVASIYDAIRKAALIQYTAPFTTVDMAAMARAFNTAVGPLEKELATLITDGHIKARIDSHAKVLHKRSADVRTATFAKLLSVGEEVSRETKALLLRASLLQHDVVQRARGTRAGGGGGGGGGGGPPGSAGGGGGGGGLHLGGGSGGGGLHLGGPSGSGAGQGTLSAAHLATLAHVLGNAGP